MAAIGAYNWAYLGSWVFAKPQLDKRFKLFQFETRDLKAGI